VKVSFPQATGCHEQLEITVGEAVDISHSFGSGSLTVVANFPKYKYSIGHTHQLKSGTDFSISL
jgi:hypothetical protein